MTKPKTKIRRSVPVTEQIRSILRERLRDGHYGNQGRFPSEESLANEFEASRATVRTAIASLVAEGLVFRSHGVGTFVASHNDRLDSGLERLESVLSMARRQEFKTRMANLTVETIPATDRFVECLKVPESSHITFVRRTIMVGGKPVSYLVDFVPEKWLTPKDIDDSFSGSILDLIIRRYPDLVRTAVADVTAVAANGKLCKLLRVSPRASLLLFSETVFDEAGTAVTYSDNYFIPGQFHFHVIRR